MPSTYDVIRLIVPFILFTGTSIQAEDQTMWNETWTDKLKRDLFPKYDKFARPAEYYNTTVVNFDIVILHLSVDEFKSTVTLNAWAYYTWTDEKLKWNTSMYGGLEYLHVGNHEIWQPDILPYNSGTANTLEHYGDTLCIVSHKGLVIWVPPVQLVALCDLDLRFWPFDTQVCSFKLGSWTYHVGNIDLRLVETNTDERLVVKKGAWTLANVSKTRSEDYYPCCKEAYAALTFKLTLRRNSDLYYDIFIVPSIAVIFLTLACFWLSPESETKVTLAACTTLTICLLLVHIGTKVPLSLSTPLIVYFYSGSLCLVTISLVISMLVINLSKRPHCNRPLPRNVRLLLMNWPGKLLGLTDLITAIESRRQMPAQELRGKLTEEFTTNSSSNIAEDCDRQNMIYPLKNTIQLEWMLAGAAMDRLAFILFSLIFAGMAILCIV